MRHRRDAARIPPALAFNATPMVDVIFMLTIFFMLVSRFSSAEQVPMELPAPAESQAKVTRIPAPVIINCRRRESVDSAAPPALYSIGPNRPEALATIADRLAVMKDTAPNLQVVIRADRRLPYEAVRAVMRVVAANKIELLNVVAHVAEEP